jgi:translation initiation factor 1
VKNNPFEILSRDGLPAGPPDPTPRPPARGRVVLRRQTAGRAGKTVIVIDEFAPQLPASELERVARLLKIACACGGTVKGRRVEIQADQPGRIRAALEAEGYRVAGVR